MFCQGAETAFRYSFKYRQIQKDSSTFLERIAMNLYKTPGAFLFNLRLVSLSALTIGTYSLLSAVQGISVLQNSQLGIFISAITIILTTIIVGIVIPRYICGRHPDNALKSLSFPLYLTDIIISPISKILLVLPHIIMRIFNISYNDKHLSYLIAGRDLMDPKLRPSISTTDPDIRENDMKIFRNALDFSNIKVRDCIVPRTEIVAVEIGDGQDELLKTFTNSGKSKIIVYEEDLDHIIGYVHSSDMFKTTTNRSWKNSIRQVPIVPESMNAQKMMQIFMQQKKSVAVVVDEFGGTTGIISLEDLVEEIFGDIEDEHDVVTLTARHLDDGDYLLSARLEIEKANEMFNLNLPTSDDYLTIGGLILCHYQDFPKLGQIVSVGQFHFKILKTTTAKIDLVKLKIDTE